MAYYRAFLLSTACMLGFSGFSQSELGEWKDHFSYRRITAIVEAEGKVYAAASSGLFILDRATGELDRLSKVNGLNDVNITTLAWEPNSRSLLVGYQSGNLDMVSRGRVRNVSDVKRSNMIGDKTVRRLYAHNGLVYMACGFGIVTVDPVRSEVRDTYIIGRDATNLGVRDLVVHGDSLYAATDSGLYAASMAEPNLVMYSNWHKRRDHPRANGPFTNLASYNGRLFASWRNLTTDRADEVHYFDGGWQRMTGFPAGGVVHSMVALPGDELLTVTYSGSLLQFNNELRQDFSLYLLGERWLESEYAYPRNGGGAWVGTFHLGMVEAVPGRDPGAYLPNCPGNNTVFSLSAYAGRVYVATGGVADNWTNMFNKAGIYRMKDGRWSTVDLHSEPFFGTGANTYGSAVNDILAVTIDPDDPDRYYASSWEEGVIEMYNERYVQVFNSTNSSLQTQVGSNPAEGMVRVGGAAFDEDGNMWVSNGNAQKPISVRRKNGSWTSFDPGATLGSNALLSRIVVGQNGYKWLIRPRGNGLLVFDDRGTINDTSDDRYKVLNSTEGSGGLPVSDVLSVAVDQDGEVWVGTSRGVAVYHVPEAVFSPQGVNAQQIMIQQDGNFQYLLETEAVTAIAVDGADRKWFGTQSGGVFLVSADGTGMLANYTKENSPLPSNTISALVVDGNTGEVYIGTDAGLVSFRGSATEGVKPMDCAQVFPNPHRPEHTGPVVVTGLARDSDVRITDVAGNLVHRTRSLGGQAVWDVTDMAGQRVSTGVYMVFVNDRDGLYSCNTKVVVVR